MNMQYAKAVIAHEEAQRRRLDSMLNTNYLGSTRSAHPHDERPDIRSWPRGCVCL